MRKLLITLVSILILTGAAEARMYQWTNPASGTVQLSGTALSWYRNFEKGPRVFVFENGELIDDTEVQVAETQRLQLRAAAFESTGGDISIEEEAENNAKELHAAMEKATEFGVDVRSESPLNRLAIPKSLSRGVPSLRNRTFPGLTSR